MLDPRAMRAVQEDYHELMTCIDEQEAMWRALAIGEVGESKNSMLKKIQLLQESRKSIEELYSIYFDCHDEDWDRVVAKASKAFNLTMKYEGMV